MNIYKEVYIHNQENILEIMMNNNMNQIYTIQVNTAPYMAGGLDSKIHNFIIIFGIEKINRIEKSIDL